MIIRFYNQGKEVFSVLTASGLHAATWEAHKRGIMWDDYRITKI